MTTLDKIKGASKFVASYFLFGDEVNALQADRLRICQTVGAGGTPCHNFASIPTNKGYTPRCCTAGESGCAPYHNGCGCFLMNKTKFQNERCPLGHW